MHDIQLVKLDPAIDETLYDNPAYLGAMVEERWDQAAEIILQLVGKTLTQTPLSVDQLHWDGYYVVDKPTQNFVGSCAFKGEPTKEGTVEIAYFTYPDYQGQGYATLMARKLIELARSSSAIDRVIAHTLPNKSASTSVLEKVGMTFVSETTDPEDGSIWLWEILVAE